MVSTACWPSKRTGAAGAWPPALRIARSMPPKSASIAATVRATAARSVTSTGYARTSAPRPRASAARASRRSARLALIASRAPRSASGPMSASPMPELAPVSQTRASLNCMRPRYVPLRPDVQRRDQRQMIRGDERTPRAHELHALDFDLACVIDVIEVHERQHTRIRAAAPQVRRKVDAIQALAEQRRGGPARPLIEIAEHDLRSGDTAMADDRGEPFGLHPTLEDRRAEVHVVDVQRPSFDVHVHPLAAARFARLPGQVVAYVVHDGEAAEHDVAVGVAAEDPRGRHDPAHAERRADLLRLALVPRAGADHLLQRDDVGANALQHF